jgi:epoxide hydrolase 4
VRLHYVEAGDGPMVVLLHGVPEFWYGWRRQIAALVEAGCRVVAPDPRGSNLSSRPDDFTDYAADTVAADVPLIRELGAESAMLVGHAWGGSAAWTLAMNDPEVVERLAIVNAAHPRKLNEGLRHPRQLLRSWFPKWPEHHARAANWRFCERFVRDARLRYTAEEFDHVEAWSPPGAATGMIDYYRAAVRLGSKQESLARSRRRAWSSGARATATSAASSPSPTTRTCRTIAASAGPTRRTGCITTRPSG